jgi:NAD-dependent dihydropyrimidine dehydrogenase PreA subunit
LAFLGLLVALSLFLPNFWCRYLCPYGAALGILSVFAPFKVERDVSRCTNCGQCSRACPEGLAVATADSVDSPACTRCLDCVVACPRRGALGVSAAGRLPLRRKALYPALFLAAFFGILFAAQAAGHWETNISSETYARLIPRFDAFNHP